MCERVHVCVHDALCVCIASLVVLVANSGWLQVHPIFLAAARGSQRGQGTIEGGGARFSKVNSHSIFAAQCCVVTCCSSPPSGGAFTGCIARTAVL